MFGSNDPNNPMASLLGDLMKAIGTAQGGGDAWFEAARTLAHSVATEGEADENADPLVRMAFEELGRVADLHVANATGIALVGRWLARHLQRRRPGQWSFQVLEAYRPTLQLMVEAHSRLRLGCTERRHGPVHAR